MSSSVSRARHRSAVRPTTPLTGLAKAIAIDSRKGLAVAAGAGVAISITAGSVALADPGDGPEPAPVAEVQTTTVTTAAEAKVSDTVAEARLAVSANPAITAPDTSWSEGEVALPSAEAPVEEVRSENTARVVNVPERTAPTARRAPAPAVHAPAPAAPVADAAPAAPAPAAPAPAPAAAPQPAQQAAQAVAPSPVGGSVVDLAMRYQGVPYRYGGTTPKGFDCSGFVQYVYGQTGTALPRTSWAQGGAGQKVSAGSAQPGDLVYYGGHVGIYLGGGKMIHSPKPGESVRVQNVYGHPSYVRVGG